MNKYNYKYKINLSLQYKFLKLFKDLQLTFYNPKTT